MAELAEQVDEEPRGHRIVSEAMADALVREAVGLAVLGVLLLVMDERFRIWARGMIGRVRWSAGGARKAAEDHAAAVFMREVSEFEHQAVKKDGGCGCV